MSSRAFNIQNRRTPPWLVAFLADYLKLSFVLDAFASAYNSVAPQHISEEQDGTVTDWLPDTFSNPPFKITGKAVEQALRQGRRGIHSVSICPSMGSQAWAHGPARYGTVLLPDARINFLLPDGRPTGIRRPGRKSKGDSGADRDTTILAFGPRFANPDPERGWLVLPLPVSRAMPLR